MRGRRSVDLFAVHLLGYLAIFLFIILCTKRIGALAGIGADLLNFQHLSGEIGSQLVQICHHREFIGDREKHHVGGFDQAWNSEGRCCIEGLKEMKKVKEM